MFSCDICGREYSQKCGLYRHKREDKLCKRIEKLQDKCSKLKYALKSVVEENKEIKTSFQQTNEDNIKLRKEVQQLNDDKNLLYRQLEITKGRLEERRQLTDQFMEVAKNESISTQNNTIINNNNTIIIKNVYEFDESRKEQLIDYIHDKEIKQNY